MLFKRTKLKSFGLTESVIASVVVIVVLSAAIALSSNTIKTTELNASFTEAQHISENIFESVNLVKSSGQVYFDGVPRSDGGIIDYQIIDINCFDTIYYYNHQSSCLPSSVTDELPLSSIPFLDSTYLNDPNDPDDPEGYYLVSADQLNNPSFGDNFFSYKITVIEPAKCYSSGLVDIPKEKCRKVLTDIMWEEVSGVKHYRQGMYLTDWER